MKNGNIPFNCLFVYAKNGSCPSFSMPHPIPYLKSCFHRVCVLVRCKNTNKPTRPTLPPQNSFPALRAIDVIRCNRPDSATGHARNAAKVARIKEVFGYRHHYGRSCNPIAESLSHGQGMLLAATTQSQSSPMSMQIAVTRWGEGGRSLGVIGRAICKVCQRAIA